MEHGGACVHPMVGSAQMPEIAFRCWFDEINGLGLISITGA
jgi:hypothetical protein